MTNWWSVALGTGLILFALLAIWVILVVRLATNWWSVALGTGLILFALLAIWVYIVQRGEDSKMSIEDTDAAAAAVATAPRVSLADIERAIAHRYDFTAGEAIWKTLQPDTMPNSLRTLSVCLLVTRNGFTVIGKSAPASDENFDPDLGKRFAYEDAIRQLWPLMGYALRDRLWRDSDDAMTFAKAIGEGLVDDGTLSP